MKIIDRKAFRRFSYRYTNPRATVKAEADANAAGKSVTHAQSQRRTQ